MVEREKSWEAIPFRVRYHLELPGEYRVVAVVDDLACPRFMVHPE